MIYSNYIKKQRQRLNFKLTSMRQLISFWVNKPKAFGAVATNCIAKIIKHNTDFLRETDSNKLKTIA